MMAGAWGTGNGAPGEAKYDNFKLQGNTPTTTTNIHWLVTDQLGTPRMIFDLTGSLANTSRHDYLPFGEDLAGVGGRAPALGYTNADGARQKFTRKERDNETGLDYFNARYYASMQGRFTSVDPTLGSLHIKNPQSLNRYVYCLNNPLAFIDPDGLDSHNEFDPRYRVDNWDKLTADQQRLFTTYVQANYNVGDRDPATFAQGIWNSSAAVANNDAQAGPNSNLLNQSQLTTFLGTTSMMEKTGVIRDVASITKIVGYENDNGFRVFGELKNMESAKAVRDKFDGFMGGIGKGGGEYSESHRERFFLKVPNGQFKMVPDTTKIDVDVDYRTGSAHLTTSNSDIRADNCKGAVCSGESQFRMHEQRYGPVPAIQRVAPY